MAATALCSFSLLPQELRLEIWQWSLPRHRSLEPDVLEPNVNPSQRSQQRNPETLHKLLASAEIELLSNDPVLLNVNLEAREAALAHYSFRPMFARLSHTNFVDFEVDSLALQIGELKHWSSDREAAAQMRVDNGWEWERKGQDDISHCKRDVARVRRASVALADSPGPAEQVRMLTKFMLEATRLRKLEIGLARYPVSKLADFALELATEAGTPVDGVNIVFKLGF